MSDTDALLVWDAEENSSTEDRDVEATNEKEATVDYTDGVPLIPLHFDDLNQHIN
jgi:hypothetical protein